MKNGDMVMRECISLGFLLYKILDYEKAGLSAALGEVRGVDTWLLASAASPFGASPFCPLAPSKLKPFSSAPIFHQCHAHYRRILPSTHTNNEGKWTHYCLGVVKISFFILSSFEKLHESPSKTISVWMKQNLELALCWESSSEHLPIFLSGLFVCKARLGQWLCVWLSHSFIRLVFHSLSWDTKSRNETQEED